MKKSLTKCLFLLILSCLSFDIFAQLTSGLASVWEFNETSGTTVIDALGTNNGTNNGATTNQTGKLDKSYSFATSSYVMVNHNPSLAFGTGNMSISSWVKTTNLAWEMIVEKVLSGRGFQFFKTNDGYLRFNIGANTGVSTSRTYRTSSSTITSGSFTHVAVVWNNTTGTINLYINGALANGSYGDQYGNGSDVANTNYLYVGADQVLSRWYFTGNIDQTAIWNKELSAAEISTLYNSGNGLSYTSWGGTSTPTLSVNDVSVNENSGSANFTISLSQTSTSTVSGSYATSNGSATSGSDYTSKSGSFSIGAGSLSTTVSVSILNDALYEGSETFSLNLSSPSGATISDGLGVCTITDNDAMPSLSVNDPSVSEGSGSVNFTISINQASGLPVTGSYSTSNGTATAGSDYTSKSGTFTINAGATSTTVNVLITNDSSTEGNETFNLTLSNPSGATIADGTGVCTIIDNGLPTLSVNDVSVNENSGSANFTITLSQSSSTTVTGIYATSNGTALSGSDYTAKSGTFTIAAGTTSTTVNVLITDDTTVESSETFNITLSNPSGATIADNTGVCTITDNDTPSSSVTSVNSLTGVVQLNLSLNSNNLSLSGGNTVTLPGTDNLGNHTAIQNLNLAGYKLIGNGSSDGIYITNTGNVGIKTTNPGDYELAVNGEIRAKEVIVNTGWADYVFDKSYRLKSLEELENYINQNNHLPEIPTATEVEANGIGVGKMNMLLLKKVEELTLYLLQQEKRMKELEAKMGKH